MGAISITFETIAGRSPAGLGVAGPSSDAAVRPSGLWLLAAAALTIALAVPFFVVDVPPVLDYPNHLARYFVLAHPDDSVLSQMYAPHWRLLPNLGMDVLGSLLLQVTDVHAGGRMLLALSLFAPVIGVIVYSRAAFGRFSLWPLASGVVAYNGVFFLGFMNFLLSLGLAFIGGAIWMILRERGFAIVAALAGAVAVALIFLCHIFGVILFALLISADEAARLMRSRRARSLEPRAIVRAGLLIALTLSPAAAFYLASPLSDGAAAPGPWSGVTYKLWALLTPVMTHSFDLTLWSALAALACLGLIWRHRIVAPGAALIAAALGVAYLLAPSAIKGGTFVDVRLAVMIGLLPFACLMPQLTRRHARLVFVALAALIVVRTGTIAMAWIAHRQDLADVRAAIAGIAPGARVLVARGRPADRTDVEQAARALPGIYRLDGHLAALLLIERRAFWPTLFADPGQQPLCVKAPYDRIAQPLGESVDWPVLSQRDIADDVLRRAHYLRDWRRHFDHVLLIDPPVDATPPHGLTPSRSSGFAVLYAVTPSPPPL